MYITQRALNVIGPFPSFNCKNIKLHLFCKRHFIVSDHIYNKKKIDFFQNFTLI